MRKIELGAPLLLDHEHGLVCGYLASPHIVTDCFNVVLISTSEEFRFITTMEAIDRCCYFKNISDHFFYGALASYRIVAAIDGENGSIA